jgi:hypothetical protein
MVAHSLHTAATDEPPALRELEPNHAADAILRSYRGSAADEKP